MSDKRIVINGKPLNFTWENSRFKTDISSPLNFEYPGSYTLEPIYTGDDAILVLEKVVEKSDGKQCYWFMWYNLNGIPLLTMSGVIGLEDIHEVLKNISNIIDKAKLEKSEDTFLKRVQNKYEDIKIIAIGIILLTVFGVGLKFYQDMEYIKDKLADKTKFKNSSLLSTFPIKKGGKGTKYVEFNIQFSDVQLYIQILDNNRLESTVRCLYEEVHHEQRKKSTIQDSAGTGLNLRYVTYYVDTIITKGVNHLYETYYAPIFISENDSINIHYIGGVKNNPTCNLFFRGKRQEDIITGELEWKRADGADSIVHFTIKKQITLNGY